LIIKTILRLF